MCCDCELLGSLRCAGEAFEAAIADGFGNVFGVDILACVQIGDGAGNAGDTI